LVWSISSVLLAEPVNPPGEPKKPMNETDERRRARGRSAT
jgi:hypothetical protein